jgi:hypothetical protein
MSSSMVGIGGDAPSGRTGGDKRAHYGGNSGRLPAKSGLT